MQIPKQESRGSNRNMHVESVQRVKVHTLSDPGMVFHLDHVQPGIYHTVEPAVEVVQGVVRVWVQVFTLRGGNGG